MFKSLYFRLGLILIISFLSFLIAIPKLTFTSSGNEFSIGGYVVNIGNKLVLDLSSYKKGLDLEGGVRLVLKADTSEILEENREDALAAAKQTIEQRINLFGVSEPYVATLRTPTEDRIIVEIPGVSDVSAAVTLIGQTAQLNFKQLKPGLVYTEDLFFEFYTNPYVWEETDLKGSDLENVQIVFNQSGVNSSSPQILLQFSPEGRKKFSELVKQNVEKPIALFLDNSEIPLSMPTVSADLANGVVTDPVISGNFDIETAKELSIQMRSGALPIPVEVLEQKTIGASLGAVTIEKSLAAGIIGLVLVLVFMVYMYGFYGVIAGFALILYSLIVLSIFKLIPVVLTLPGIAGYILSIGMATDANVLIFERIKEERALGTPKHIAISNGFERAWSSIKASNVSSLITSFILFYLGTGPVRGFALTLSIGIVVSIFSAVFVVKTLINYAEY